MHISTFQIESDAISQRDCLHVIYFTLFGRNRSEYAQPESRKICQY